MVIQLAPIAPLQVGAGRSSSCGWRKIRWREGDRPVPQQERQIWFPLSGHVNTVPRPTLGLKGYKGRGDEAAEAVWQQEISKLW
jgi:hypothetical protein